MIRFPLSSLVGATLFLLWLAPHDARGQIIASEHGSVSQTVDGTVMTIEYSRPTLRGRKDIFNTEVPRNKLWTPGADSATTFEFSKDVTINGTPVPAGRYSVWMVTAHGDWQVILDPDTEKFHLPHPEPTQDQIALVASPDTMATRMETLVFYFPVVRSDGAVLRMHWENTRVDLDIGVYPTRDLTITAEAAAPYVGRYAVEVAEGPQGPARSFELDLTHSDRHLGGRMEIWPDYPFDTFLAPAAEQVFNPVWIMNGQVAGVLDFLFFEFTLGDDGRAVSFEARGPDDQVWLSGSRIGDS